MEPKEVALLLPQAELLLQVPDGPLPLTQLSAQGPGTHALPLHPLELADLVADESRVPGLHSLLLRGLVANLELGDLALVGLDQLP